MLIYIEWKVITVFLENVNFSRQLRCEINEFHISCHACQNAVFPNKSRVWASKIFINSRYALVFNNPSTAGSGVRIDKTFYRQSSVKPQQNFICRRFQNVLRRWCFNFEFFDLWFNCYILIIFFNPITFSSIEMLTNNFQLSFWWKTPGIVNVFVDFVLSFASHKQAVTTSICNKLVVEQL